MTEFLGPFLLGVGAGGALVLAIYAATGFPKPKLRVPAPTLPTPDYPIPHIAAPLDFYTVPHAYPLNAAHVASPSGYDAIEPSSAIAIEDKVSRVKALMERMG